MERKCKICGKDWDASSKTSADNYKCPNCDGLAQVEIRYPTPSRKFRHNKKAAQLAGLRATN